MEIIIAQNHDPYFNIATEEYLLKNSIKEILYLYSNEPSIVIGKHQNAFKEANPDNLELPKTPVIRRISGGGTVYHDRGNLNITLIKNKTSERLNTSKLLSPLLMFLKTLNKNITEGIRNEFRINGKKISGTAVHSTKDRVLCHATLLIDSNLSNLEKAIAIQKIEFMDKAINSVRSEVTNLKNHTSTKKISVEVVTEKIVQFFLENSWGSYVRELDSYEKNKITELCNEKYKTWKWNYAYSPKFEVTFEIGVPNKKKTIQLKIVDGKVAEIVLLQASGRDEQIKSILNNLTIGKKFSYVTIYREIEEILELF